MTIRILRLPDVIHRTGMSRSAIYAHEKNGTFPKRVQLSARSVGWIESEVEAWLKARASAA
jgi:prophage regulatory protein